MKNILFTGCILAAPLSQANAQVSKSDFNTNINALNTAIAKNDAAGQKNAFDRLNSMLSEEIAYRTSNRKAIPLQGRQDSLQAEKAFKKAADDYNKAMAEPDSSTAQSKAKKIKDLEDAARERTASLAELKKASGERQLFVNNRDNLVIEQKIRHDWIPLIGTNIPANQSNINNCLKQFAATL